MRKYSLLNLLYTICLLLFITACQPSHQVNAVDTVTSPDGAIQVTFSLNDGVPTYQIDKGGQPVLLPSALGFEFKDAPLLKDNFGILDVDSTSYDQAWTQPWGEVMEIREHYDRIRIALGETAPEPRVMAITFRVFDDGVGFRYELPEEEHLADFEIMDELTSFVMAGDYDA